jgi:hypothetical protein
MVKDAMAFGISPIIVFEVAVVTQPSNETATKVYVPAAKSVGFKTVETVLPLESNQ